MQDTNKFNYKLPFGYSMPFAKDWFMFITPNLQTMKLILKPNLNQEKYLAQEQQFNNIIKLSYQMQNDLRYHKFKSFNIQFGQNWQPNFSFQKKNQIKNQKLNIQNLDEFFINFNQCSKIESPINAKNISLSHALEIPVNVLHQLKLITEKERVLINHFLETKQDNIIDDSLPNIFPNIKPN